MGNCYGVIYLIRNRINGKVYIGQTTDFEYRVSQYKKLHCKPQRKIYNALKEFGFHNFHINIIDTANDRQTLDGLEIYHIERFKSREDSYGYNIKGGGSKGEQSDETKIKISLANTGRKQTEEAKRNMSKAQRGLKRHTEESKRKLSEAGKKRKGEKRSEETKKRMSIARSGKCLSEEHKKKVSEAKKGHLTTDETRKRISEAKKGKSWTEERRLNGRRKASDETRKRMSESHKKRGMSEETKRILAEARRESRNLKKSIANL